MDADNPDKPRWLELERVIPLPEVADITNLSRDSLDRHHRSKYVRLSPRRLGMTLKNALAIAAGK
jgi:hypothetical protein